LDQSVTHPFIWVTIATALLLVGRHWASPNNQVGVFNRFVGMANDDNTFNKKQRQARSPPWPKTCKKTILGALIDNLD